MRNIETRVMFGYLFHKNKPFTLETRYLFLNYLTSLKIKYIPRRDFAILVDLLKEMYI